MQMHQGRT